MTEKPAIADFTDIEYRDDLLKCPQCGEWRRGLLCVGGGRMVCRECKNANKRRVQSAVVLEDEVADALEVAGVAGTSARRADEHNACP